MAAANEAAGRTALAALPPAARHARLLAALPPARSDLDALRKAHRFVRAPADDAAAAAAGGAAAWEARLAQRYYDRLFKEYAIADLSRHREGAIGLRWRTAAEVRSSLGQLSCGAAGCEERRGLASFELFFAYVEAGERRRALVKVRVCPPCAHKLNYKRERARERDAAREERRRARRERRRARKRRRRDASGSLSGDVSSSGGESGGDGEGVPRPPAAAAPPAPPPAADADDPFAGLFQ
jgi:hypothetical protein